MPTACGWGLRRPATCRYSGRSAFRPRGRRKRPRRRPDRRPWRRRDRRRRRDRGRPGPAGHTVTSARPPTVGGGRPSPQCLAPMEMFTMADLQKLKAEILADGRIDDEEVQRIKAALYADGVIDKEEVDFLIALRN